jgi:GntR family transcriptional regulator
VSPLPPFHRYAGRRWDRAERERDGAHGAFQSEAEQAGLVSRSDLVLLGTIEPPAYVAAGLCLQSGELTVTRQRKMYAGRDLTEYPAVHVQSATSYVPLSLAEGTAIEQEDTGPGGIMSRLGDLGHEPAEFTETLTVRTAGAWEAGYLPVGPGEKVIEIIHVAMDADGLPVLLTLHLLDPDAWVLHSRFSRGG